MQPHPARLPCPTACRTCRRRSEGWECAQKPLRWRVRVRGPRRALSFNSGNALSACPESGVTVRTNSDFLSLCTFLLELFQRQRPSERSDPGNVSRHHGEHISNIAQCDTRPPDAENGGLVLLPWLRGPVHLTLSRSRHLEGQRHQHVPCRGSKPCAHTHPDSNLP